MGGRLRGQVAGAPDDGDKEKHCVSAAGETRPYAARSTLSQRMMFFSKPEASLH